MAKSKKEEIFDKEDVKVVDEVTIEEEVIEEVKEVLTVEARSAVDILTLNHREVVYTINNSKPKTKSIQRAEHKAIASGDYSSLK